MSWKNFCKTLRKKITSNFNYTVEKEEHLQCFETAKFYAHLIFTSEVNLKHFILDKWLFAWHFSVHHVMFLGFCGFLNQTTCKLALSRQAWKRVRETFMPSPYVQHLKQHESLSTNEGPIQNKLQVESLDSHVYYRHPHCLCLQSVRHIDI